MIEWWQANQPSQLALWTGSVCVCVCDQIIPPYLENFQFGKYCPRKTQYLNINTFKTATHIQSWFQLEHGHKQTRSNGMDAISFTFETIRFFFEENNEDIHTHQWETNKTEKNGVCGYQWCTNQWLIPGKIFSFIPNGTAQYQTTK